MIPRLTSDASYLTSWLRTDVDEGRPERSHIVRSDMDLSMWALTDEIRLIVTA
jgi:hypothetical protein